MTPYAAIRASEVDLPLIVHVLGAMALVGLLLAAALALLMSARADSPDGAAALTRFGLWTLVAGAVPAWVVMRVGAQWTYVRAGWDDVPEDPAWLGVGFLTADLGGLLLLVGAVLAVVGLRRRDSGGARRGLGRAAGVVAALLVLAYVVAIWAMTTKPA